MNKNKFPLSHNQTALYLINQHSPTDTSFNIPLLLKLNHGANPNILAESIRYLAKRYPILLLSINTADTGDLFNHINDVTLPIEILTIISESDLSQLLYDKLHIPFNTNQAPLIRFYLIKKNEEKLLYIVYHHILSDDLPTSFLYNLKEIYNSLYLGIIPQLNPPDYSYADYVEWEKNYPQTENGQNDGKYWHGKFEQSPNHTFTFSANTMHDINPRYLTSRLVLDALLCKKIQEKAKNTKVSTFTLFLTALFTLVHKYTNKNDIQIETVINNRFHRHYFNLLGDFTNTITLREFINDNSMDELLNQVSNTVISAMQHGRLHYYKIREQLNIKSSSPISIVYHHLQRIINKTDDYLTMEMRHDICQNPNKDFNLEIIYGDHECILLFKYNDLFISTADIINVVNDYQVILENVSELTSININDIMLSKNSSHHVANNNDECIHTVFEKVSFNIPDVIAIEHGQSNITYAELNKRANKLARHIKSTYQNIYHHEIPKETVIGIYLPKGIEAIIAMLAVIKMGACYLPLDVTYPKKRIIRSLNKADAALTITKNQLINQIDKLHIIDIDSHTLSHLNDDNVYEHISANYLAYIIYTSGTTGDPNGVAIEHTGVVNLAEAQGNLFGIELGTRVIQFASLAFDASASEIWCTLLRKGTLCIPASENKLIGFDLSDFLKQERIDVATIPPSILATIQPGSISINTIVLAGETANSSLMATWKKYARIINAYGPTEATVCATMHEYQFGDLNTNIGKSINNVHIYLLDSNKNYVTNHVDGEIYIGGISIARGYYQDEVLTANKFFYIPLITQASRLYKTGDLGRYLPDGSIEYRGRIDTQVKIRGFRIEIEEIENVITQFDKVKYAAIAVDKAIDEIRLIAFIVPKDEQLSLSELKQHITIHLPRHMHPNDYQFINSLPLTSNNKIDRKKLLTFIKSKKQTTTQNDDAHSFDDIFINLCSEILMIDKDKLDLNSSFFHCGGTSLTILKFISRINKQLGAEISINTVFKAPSLQFILDTLKAKIVIHDNIDHAANDFKIIINSEVEINNDLKNNTGIYNILLTGASGFLGIHLLMQLLKVTNNIVYCLMRGKNIDEARNKLIQRLIHFGATNINESRINIFLGDLASPNLGLSNSTYNELCNNINAIFHCGAEVNHIYPYNALRSANVLSTVELLKIAGKKHLKRIHYISTIDTVTSASEDFDSEQSVMKHCSLSWGYIKSKWVSEKILFQSNVPCTIYRPGNITGNSINGASLPHKNHASILLKACIEAGVAPNWDTHIEMTPVDWLSEVVVKLALQDNHSKKQFFNLHNPNSIKWVDYIKLINETGQPIQIIDADLWKNDYLMKLKSTNPLYMFKDIYLGNEIDKLVLAPNLIRNSKTLAALKEIQSCYFNNYQSLIYLYMRFFKKIAFIA